MTDTINKLHSPLSWAAQQTEQTPTKEDLHGAEEQTASLYYLTTLKSLASSVDISDKNKCTHAIENKSVLTRAKDWLWGIFGWGQKQPVSAQEIQAEENLDPTVHLENSLAGGIPKLQSPDESDRKRLSEAISDLNRELVSRLKDIAEFEEEMRKSSSSKLDKLIFLHLVNSSLNQKKLKEASSLNTQEDLLGLHKKNQQLQKKHFDLLDAIQSEGKARGVLKWINVGLTAIAVGGTAVGFALGGLGVFAIGLPLSYLAKGVGSLTDGILKYKMDSRTGEVMMINQESKRNTSEINEKFSDMQVKDADISLLLKSIRHHLDNQSKAERAVFARNT